MRAKKRFYWLGVIDANNCRRQRTSDWPRWQRVAYEEGQSTRPAPIVHRVNTGAAVGTYPMRDLLLERLRRMTSPP